MRLIGNKLSERVDDRRASAPLSVRQYDHKCGTKRMRSLDRCADLPDAGIRQVFTSLQFMTWTRDLRDLR